jgi:hypothetical protein
VPLGMHFYPPRYGSVSRPMPPRGGSGASDAKDTGQVIRQEGIMLPSQTRPPRFGAWYHPETGQRFMDGKPTGPEREPNPAFVQRIDLETGAPVGCSTCGIGHPRSAHTDPRWHPKAADRDGRNYGLLITVLSVLVGAIVIVLVCSLAIAGMVGLWSFIVETWPHLSPPTLGTV